MINSLYEINSALTNLTQQLQNPSTPNQSIQNSISQLISQVKYLQDKQSYNYYLLISQIYASRFNNIEQAQKYLQKFDKTLDSEISMNIQLRRAVFSYFSKNYKQSYKQLDIGLGQVQQELKLIDNARFFFNRAFNKQYLITQSRQKMNFQAAFILSLIYQRQKQEISALKQLQSFLNQTRDKFQKFIIYDRLLQLYQVMKKNSVSTISISKKSLQIYRQEMAQLQQEHPQFIQSYGYKLNFVNRIIDFIKREDGKTSQKFIKKLLDSKLLAYYKLKKCSKQAPTKQIKMTLRNTAKLIKMSKQTQLLESILNYDFIKKQYEIYKVFYDQMVYKKLAGIRFFNLMRSYTNINPKQQSINNMSGIKERSLSTVLRKQKQAKFALQQESPIMQMTKNTSQSQYNQSGQIPQSQLMSFNQYQQQPNQSILKNTQQQPMSQTIQMSKMMKQSSSAPYQMKQTISEDILNAEFQGSKMYKIHASSQGYEERYFYINPQTIMAKPRLYYCVSKNSKSSADSYYSLKGLQRISRGKHTEALKGKKAAKFNQQQCFALIFNDGKDRSFYVPDQNDYQRWIVLLQTKVLYTEANVEKMSHTMMGYGNNAKSSKIDSNMNRSSPPMKKSRKVVDI